MKYLNKEAFEESILSIDARTAAGKVSFCIIKGYKIKDYPNDMLEYQDCVFGTW